MTLGSTRELNNKVRNLHIIERLEGDKEVMISYLKLKTREEDWHGVSDAANDLRELEIRLANTK